MSTKPKLAHTDINWAFHRGMTQAQRDAFDQYLVSIQHPLAYEPGTQEDRFKRYWAEQQNRQ